MKTAFLALVAFSAFAQDAVKLSIEDQLKVALMNSKLLNAQVDLQDKERILQITKQQHTLATQQKDAVQKERAALLVELQKAYKVVGRKCDIDNLEAALNCEKTTSVKKED